MEKPMKKATIRNWAYMMTVMAATPSVPIQAMRIRLKMTVIMLEARLVTISEAPLAQLLSRTVKSQRGRVKRRPERFREKYLKNPGRPVTVGKLWITEGRKHQVKLMVKAVGAHVFYLKRWAIGPVRLDAALAPGAFRPLTPEELHALGL